MYWLKALRHFFISNSRHGTHSPFVYELADKVIYGSGDSVNSDLIEEIKRYYVAKELVDQSAFLVLSAKDATYDLLLNKQQDYFMIFLKDIHINKDTELLWNSVLNNNAFIVTIDLFKFGIICFRKEQPKENFILRYPYWKF